MRVADSAEVDDSCTGTSESVSSRVPWRPISATMLGAGGGGALSRSALAFGLRVAIPRSEPHASSSAHEREPKFKLKIAQRFV